MDHELSVRTKAAEQYLLGELSPEERSAFEEHYFDCEECANDVYLLEQFAANTAAVYGEDGPPVFKPVASRERQRWFGWMPSLAFASSALSVALVGLAGYQNAVVIPRLRSGVERPPAPEAVASAILVPSSRGVERTVAVPPSLRFIHLALEVGTLPLYEKYACDLRSASGVSIRKIALDTVDPAAGIHILVPAGALPAGSYDAVLLGMRGAETQELMHYRFAVSRN